MNNLDRPHVVIIGGGFAGLAAARALRRAPVTVTLIDRTNHHLFQPLLYQVATATLAPSDIAIPIRYVLRNQRNTTVLMADVSEIDVRNRTVSLSMSRNTFPTTTSLLPPAPGTHISATRNGSPGHPD